MKMKKSLKKMIGLVLAGGMAAAMLAGCGGADGEEAARANVEKLMQAAQKSDFEEMEGCIVDEEWDTDILKTLSIDAWNNFVVEQAGKISYTISDVESDGDQQVTVTVDVEYIDGSSAYAAAFNACFADVTAMMGDAESADAVSEDDIYESLDTHLKEEAQNLDEEACTANATLTFTCSEPDDWKVDSVDDTFLSVVTANLTGYANSLE